jgi:hypothetical protein
MTVSAFTIIRADFQSPHTHRSQTQKIRSAPISFSRLGAERRKTVNCCRKATSMIADRLGYFGGTVCRGFLSLRAFCDTCLEPILQNVPFEHDENCQFAGERPLPAIKEITARVAGPSGHGVKLARRTTIGTLVPPSSGMLICPE